MRKRKVKQWDTFMQGPPPIVRKFCGKRIKQAWVMTHSPTIILYFEDETAAMIESMPSNNSKHPVAVHIEVGKFTPDSVFMADTRKYANNPYAMELRGKTVTGMDGNILVFDNHYGVEFGATRLGWVMRGKQWVQ